MKWKHTGIFILGYIVFCVLMQAFGIGDLILSNIEEDLNNKSNHNKLDFIQKRTDIKPDQNSSALKVSKEELGRHTWILLHSIAASYPVEPSEEDRKSLKTFWEGL